MPETNNNPTPFSVFVCYAQADASLMDSVRVVLEFWSKEVTPITITYESLPTDVEQLQQTQLHEQADLILVGLSIDLVATQWFEQTIDDYLLWHKQKRKQIVFLHLRSVFLPEESGVKKIPYLPSKSKRISDLTPLLLGMTLYKGLQKLHSQQQNTRGFGMPTKKRPTTPEGKYYLVAIAIDEYPNSPKLTSLANAVNDAKAVVDVLQNNYGFGSAQTYALYNAEASRDRIFETFRTLADQITPQDRLFIYHAGHGVYHPFFKMGYWIPADSDFQPKQTIWYPRLEIANQDIARCIRQINALHTFVVSDSCFSGTMFNNTRSASSSEFSQKLENIPSRWGLSSGRDEPVSDGIMGEHSPFATALLEKLQQQDEPTLLISDLIQYIKKDVGKHFSQQPIGNRLLDLDEKGMGEFVLHRR